MCMCVLLCHYFFLLLKCTWYVDEGIAIEKQKYSIFRLTVIIILSHYDTVQLHF